MCMRNRTFEVGLITLQIFGFVYSADADGRRDTCVFGRRVYSADGKFTIWSHHTNSFAHIIIKFKNKKISLFLKIVALCSSSCGDYYGNIILIPIQIDYVMFCCSKSIEMIKDRSNRKSLRWL